MKTIPVIRSISSLRTQVSEWKKKGHIVGLVPTMGALHHGHLSLVDAISNKADKIIVSIFINPTQFGVGEDLDAYPKQETADCKKLSETKASLVFAPPTDEMYPIGHTSRITLSGIADILEGAERPGHFDGVATIVTKLLLQSQADVAIFGEKDYQQLAVIRQFVRDLDIPVDIVAGKLIREFDGLAASSRNLYLTEIERKIAGKFNVVLKNLIAEVLKGVDLRTSEKNAIKALLEAGFKSVDYVTVADGKTLQPLGTLQKNARVLAVARIGTVRLLDNMAIEAP